ncbi:hypothetical protein ACFV23_54010, partial [Streptomyces sp. NPDC059627]
MRVADHGGGAAHRRVGEQRAADLAEFDAVAADLDLVVEAAEVLDLSVGQLPAAVAGAVQDLFV